MKLLAIDPGPQFSAFVVWDGTSLVEFAKVDNLVMLERCLTGDYDTCVIEKIASFGMAVGAEVFETVYWSGRFAQAFGAESTHRITRNVIKNHLCHSSKAKDGNIRQAIIDRFGGEAAIGKKASKGPLYKVSGDCWSALAVALTWWDQIHAS